MKYKVKISVLLSFFNTDFITLKRAIDSVLNQDFQDFELIIIDDGSKNNIHISLLEYIIKYEDKITYLRHFNIGQAESINRGVLTCKGEFITIIDADDEYSENHLSSCLNEIKDFDLIASTTKTVVNSEDDFYVPDKIDQTKLIHVDKCILFATLFGKRNVFFDIKFFGEYAADAHFYEVASMKYLVKKVNLRTYIYYRNNPKSIVSVMKNKQNKLL